MRFVYLCLLCATSVVSQVPPSVTSTRFIVVAGQSNANGHGAPLEEIDTTPDPDIVDTEFTTGTPVQGTEPFYGLNYSYFTTIGDTTVTHYSHRIGLNPNPGVGPCGELARRYRQQFPSSSRTQIIKCAFGGSSFGFQSSQCPVSVNGSTSQTWFPNGTCYLECRNRIARAFASPSIGNASVAFVYFHQGETDGLADIEISVYRSYVELLVDGMRGQLGALYAWQGISNSTPVITSGAHNVWTSQYTYGSYTAARVTAGSADLMNTRPNIGFASPVGLAPSTFHLDTFAQRQLARAAVLEVKRILDTQAGTLSPTGAPTRAPTGTGGDPYAGSVPAGTVAYFPMNGHMNDYGPYGFDPFTIFSGLNQSILYTEGPYPFNDTLVWKVSPFSTGHCATVYHDQREFNPNNGGRALLSGIQHLLPSAFSAETTAYNPNVTEEVTVSLWYYYEGSANGTDVPWSVVFSGPGSVRQLRGVVGTDDVRGATVANGYFCVGAPAGTAPTRFRWRSWDHYLVRSRNLTLELFINGVKVLADANRCSVYTDLRDVVMSMATYPIATRAPTNFDCATEYRRGLRVYRRWLSDAEALDLYNAEGRTGVSVQAQWNPRGAEPSVTRWSFEGSSILEPTTGNHRMVAHSSLMFWGWPGNPATPSLPNRTFVSKGPSGTYGNYVYIQELNTRPVVFSEPLTAWTLCHAFYILSSTGVCYLGGEVDACPDTNGTLSTCEMAFIEVSATTGTVNARWGTGNTAPIDRTIQRLEWHHLCITADNTPTNAVVVVYLDGQIVASRIRVGRRTLRPSVLGLGVTCNAYYDEVMVADWAFNAPEVASEAATVMNSSNPTSVPTPAPTATPTSAPTTVQPTSRKSV